MAGRSSRKRGRRQARPGGGATAPPAPPVAAAEQPAPSEPRRRKSSEERNAAVRASLQPLAPGERPWPLRIAAAVALLLAVGNLVQVAVGSKVKFANAHTSVSGVALFSLVMLVCAIGMWQRRYWAVLGFQALLAIVILIFCFVLVTSTDILRAVISVAIVGGGGVLFFKLVRVLSRLQMPSPHGRS